MSDSGGNREPTQRPNLAVVVREWGRIGCVGFGGPPTHIKLLSGLCVERKKWLTPVEFEDAVAACNLLPGPASTQLAIFCAWRVRGRLGALVGGAAFIVPGLILILALAALFLAGSPPRPVVAAGAGAVQRSPPWQRMPRPACCPPAGIARAESGAIIGCAGPATWPAA
jgi:chromate transporter